MIVIVVVNHSSIVKTYFLFPSIPDLYNSQYPYIVLPKIQANNAGAGDALMLDTDGFVSETNATNVFMVKRGVLYTPHADYCLPGEY